MDTNIRKIESADPLLSSPVTRVTPRKGRDEEGLDFSMAWIRRHDEYED